MGKKIESIVQGQQEPSHNSLWLKDGELLYYGNGWQLVSTGGGAMGFLIPF